LLRGEFFQETRNSLTIEVTTTGKLLFVKAVARARDWYEQIVAGEVGTVGQLAQKTGLPSTYIKQILGCAMLSPQIIEMVLSGRHRPNLILRDPLHNGRIDWRQAQMERGSTGDLTQKPI